MATEVRDAETFAVIGAAMEVHRVLGRGFVEPVYQAALEVELKARGLPHLREEELPVMYKGQRIDTKYKVDFICFGEVIVELKALQDLSDVERSQILNYLKASGFRRGLLINFGTAKLQFERFVADWSDSAIDR